jgi:hypothetical protein
LGAAEGDSRKVGYLLVGRGLGGVGVGLGIPTLRAAMVGLADGGVRMRTVVF